MAKQYGKHYPERPLMAVISDLLGIPHFSTANGSTVRKDFLRAVAGAVQVPDYLRLKKDPLLAAIIEHVTGEPMDPALFSPGTTITDEALQTIINGIVENGWLPGRASTGSVVDVLALDDAALALWLDPEHTYPPDVRQQLVNAYRDEHDEFRQRVFAAYEGRCAVTGVDVSHSLKAVHVVPPSEGGPDAITNGVLLRKDLAAMFENGVIAFDEQTYTVVVHPKVLPAYDELVGRALRPPVVVHHRPAERGLRWRRDRAGL